MGGYLDQYGAGDERRAKRIKTALLAVVARRGGGSGGRSGLLLLHPQRRRAPGASFLRPSHRPPIPAGVRSCGDAPPRSPAPGILFRSFLKDWGPAAVPPGAFQVLNGESCGSGSIVDVDTGQRRRQAAVGREIDFDTGLPAPERVQSPQPRVRFSPRPEIPPARAHVSSRTAVMRAPAAVSAAPGER
jgi:hypothetical protein